MRAPSESTALCFHSPRPLKRSQQTALRTRAFDFTHNFNPAYRSPPQAPGRFCNDRTPAGGARPANDLCPPRGAGHQSLLMHLEAVRLLRDDPTLATRALETVSRWRETADPGQAHSSKNEPAAWAPCLPLVGHPLNGRGAAPGANTNSPKSLIWRAFQPFLGHLLHSTPDKKTATLRWLYQVLGRTSLGDLKAGMEPASRCAYLGDFSPRWRVLPDSLTGNYIS